ncbi:zinc-binding alcohol dehydrogenase family protein [Sphaerochaeta pleomorpha str. Grapes]|uniref:Zinc-type alcohol dehydrogenase-like protein n=1 Tax=Sphaerochaeta pleomorpha (strain ATCC BAA-1885 / DSM 22778 / Grapes) TaxID=158190 RepID=G8QUT5_SPHPG|nr:zinc-binding alcohol dehydrogenase family protein [Sphaerochaeta pleomorpha]AEV28111.1 zinc-binding alcohol dehydrogenase family protein [Sphaerochaeta pleomorpha str. Grapes]
MEKNMKAILAKAGSEAKDEGAFYEKMLLVPEPGPHDLLVRVKAIGMNPVDTKVRKRLEKDTVLGWDVCGMVEKTGSNVTKFNAGDRVYYAGALQRPGCNSEYHLVDCRLAALAPDKLSHGDIAAMPLTSITAWEGLFERLGFIPKAHGNKGKSILIVGGSGGVGSMAIQLAHWAGLHVVATASRPETVVWCKKLGAEVSLNHKNDLYTELQKSGHDSVDAIFCTTQIENHWKAMAECISPQGRIVLISDPNAPLDITLFKQKSVAICWEFMFTRSMYETGDMAEQGKLLATIADLVKSGDIVTNRQKTLLGLTPENIQAMHILQESETMMGKQVLIL